MSLPRLRLENCVKEGDVWRIDEEQARHLVTVRRCYHGSLVEGLLDGQKVELKLLCEGKDVSAIELSRTDEPEPYPKITLILALLKADQFDLALRMSAELGVSEIRLAECDRSVPKFDGKKLAAKTARWRKILDEATKQAGSTRPPALHPPVPLLGLDLEALPEKRYAGILADGVRHISDIAVPPSLAIAVGPEGDWSERETEFLLSNGFEPIGLGSRILRACTAVAVSCSWFMLKGSAR